MLSPDDETAVFTAVLSLIATIEGLMQALAVVAQDARDHNKAARIMQHTNRMVEASQKAVHDMQVALLPGTVH